MRCFPIRHSHGTPGTNRYFSAKVLTERQGPNHKKWQKPVFEKLRGPSALGGQAMRRFQFDATALPPRTETTSSPSSAGQNANIIGAAIREHILREAHQHRQRHALIQFEREDAILARHLRPFFQISTNGHGLPPRPPSPKTWSGRVAPFTLRRPICFSKMPLAMLFALWQGARAGGKHGLNLSRTTLSPWHPVGGVLETFDGRPSRTQISGGSIRGGIGPAQRVCAWRTGPTFPQIGRSRIAINACSRPQRGTGVAAESRVCFTRS